MRVMADLVGLDAVDYQRTVHNMASDRDLWRSLVALDIDGFRKACQARAPHLPQPESDWQALQIMHLARIQMKAISPQQKRYSEHWLREWENKTRVVAAVGIAIKAFRPENAERAAQVQAAMSDAVLLAVKDGVDLNLETAEVIRRMSVARKKVHR